MLATSLTPESVAALTWVVREMARSNSGDTADSVDAVHLVHVVRCLHTPTEVQLVAF